MLRHIRCFWTFLPAEPLPFRHGSEEEEAAKALVLVSFSRRRRAAAAAASRFRSGRRPDWPASVAASFLWCGNASAACFVERRGRRQERRFKKAPAFHCRIIAVRISLLQSRSLKRASELPPCGIHAPPPLFLHHLEN